jgi:hypothetical protein
MSRSTTAEHLPHGALAIRRLETITSASQLKTLLQTAPVEQFPENHIIVEKSACQVAGMGPDDSEQNAYVEADLTSLSANTIRTISYPHMIVVNVEHTLTHVTCFVCI